MRCCQSASKTLHAELQRDNVKAEAIALRMPEIERLNRLIIAAEARTAATLREIERRRAKFGERLRDALQKIENAHARVSDEAAHQTRG